MGREWSTTPFGQLVDNFDSIRVPVKEADRKPGRYPYYGASGVVDHVDSYIFDGEYLLVAEDGENLKTRQTPIAFLATGKFWVNNHAHIVRANANNDTRFLMYAMRVADIGSYLTGSTMPKLTQANMNRVPVMAPPLAQQRAIARILGALDDKIELNRKMNATLEAMARALFKSWFVDFDPVRAKAEGRAPSGMDAETAKLFPSEFVDSELGPIPKGWRVGRLDDLLVLQRGFDLPTHSREPGPYPVVAASGPTAGHSEAQVRGPGVVTGRSGVLGKVFLVLEDFWPLNTALWVKEFRACGPYFAYFALQQIDFAAFNAGSAVPSLNRNHVHGLPWLLPNRTLVEVFQRFASAIFQKRDALNEQSKNLTRLRDGLLPRLLSGKLSLTQAEQVGETTG